MGYGKINGIYAKLTCVEQYVLWLVFLNTTLVRLHISSVYCATHCDQNQDNGIFTSKTLNGKVGRFQSKTGFRVNVISWQLMI